MPDANWTSADLLARFNRDAGRPVTDVGFPPDVKYQILGDAQQEVLTEIAAIVPRVLYGAPTAMTTADGGYTFTFGTDGNGYPLFPIGKARIFPSLQAVPTFPWRPGYDYLDEGIRIRMPNNTNYTGTLYWYGITIPNQISATVQPILQPPPARLLIVTKAVERFAQSYARNPALEERMQIRWAEQFPAQMLMMRTHFRGGGALGNLLAPWGAPGVLSPAWW